MKCYIYALCDPITQEVRYVGKSTNPTKRLRSHLNEKGETHKIRWIQSLLNTGEAPYLRILEEIVDNWESRERYWISFYKPTGKLTNATDGGDGVNNPSQESRDKLSATRKELYKQLEFREKMLKVTQNPRRCSKISQQLTGKKKSPEHIAKLPQNQSGKKLSPGHIEKIRATSTGRLHSGETKEKLRQLNTGRKQSEETKHKISAANLGKIQSDATRLKKSLSAKGKPKSEEWKAKIKALYAVKRAAREIL